MPIVFALTMLVSAALLFVVQPMIAKMVLPLLGGSPGGLEHLHGLLPGGPAGRLRLRARDDGAARGPPPGGRARRVARCSPSPSCRLRIPPERLRSPPTGANPSRLAARAAGRRRRLPFFVVSTTAPLLQRWFAGTGHPAAVDPYFLYGASNSAAWSPCWAIRSSSSRTSAARSRAVLGRRLWRASSVLILACAAIVWRAPRGAREIADDGADAAGADRPGLGPMVCAGSAWRSCRRA